MTGTRALPPPKPMTPIFIIVSTSEANSRMHTFKLPAFQALRRDFRSALSELTLGLLQYNKKKLEQDRMVHEKAVI